VIGYTSRQRFVKTACQRFFKGLGVSRNLNWAGGERPEGRQGHVARIPPPFGRFWNPVFL
jgi:hypothetical protein